MVIFHERHVPSEELWHGRSLGFVNRVKQFGGGCGRGSRGVHMYKLKPSSSGGNVNSPLKASACLYS